MDRPLPSSRPVDSYWEASVSPHHLYWVLRSVSSLFLIFIRAQVSWEKRIDQTRIHLNEEYIETQCADFWPLSSLTWVTHSGPKGTRLSTHPRDMNTRARQHIVNTSSSRMKTRMKSRAWTRVRENIRETRTHTHVKTSEIYEHVNTGAWTHVCRRHTSATRNSGDTETRQVRIDGDKPWKPWITSAVANSWAQPKPWLHDPISVAQHLFFTSAFNFSFIKSHAKVSIRRPTKWAKWAKWNLNKYT